MIYTPLACASPLGAKTPAGMSALALVFALIEGLSFGQIASWVL
jgi:hypothetical protein